MKKLVILLLILVSLNVVGQEFKFTLGSRITKQPSSNAIISHPKLRKVLLVSSIRQFEITSLNDYINIGSTVVVRGESLKNTVYEGYHVFNDKVYILFSVSNNDRKEQVIYSQELSSEMVLLGAPIKIATFENVKRPEAVLLEINSGELSFSRIKVGKSESQKQIALVMKHESAVEVHSFNVETGKTVSNKFQLREGSNFQITNIEVAEDGNVYILGSYYKREYLDGPFLLAYSPSTKKHKLHEIKSGEKIGDVGYNLALIDGNTPIMAGIYDKTKIKESGYNVFKIHTSSLEIEPVLSTPFPKAFNDLTYAKAYDPDYFAVRNIFKLNNGSLILSIEGGLHSHLKYASSTYVSSVFVASIENRVEKWNTIIEKGQAQPNGSAKCGHNLFHKANKVYMVYTDNLANYDLSPTEKQKDWILKNKTYVATVEIDEEGRSRKLHLISKNNNQVSYLNPRETYKIEKGLFQLSLNVGDGYHYATTSVD